MEVITTKWGGGGTVVKLSGMQTFGPGFDSPISAGHLSLFGITAEWPKTTQIAVILSSDGTYNAYMYWRL